MTTNRKLELIDKREDEHARSLIEIYFILSFVNSLLFLGTTYRLDRFELLMTAIITSIFFTSHIAFYFSGKLSILNYRHGVLLNSVASSITTALTIYNLQSTSLLNIGFFNLFAILFMVLQTFSIRPLLVSLILVYSPYFVSCAFIKDYSSSRFLLDAFFVFGTIFVFYFVLRERFREQDRVVSELIELELQIENRDSEISERSREEANLKTLSCQFSPQIIRQIKDNRLSLDSGTHVREICYIFVDIVGSTQRTNTLPPRDLQEVTNMFMEDTIKTLLYYDLTIDKFKGDAVSAFANDPVEYKNYIERTCLAAITLRNKISLKKADYKKLWRQDFCITIGIASGPCEIGFFGHQDFFKTYSAKGEAPLLAEEMSNLAQPDQIIIDSDVFDACKDMNFLFSFNGKTSIPSFKDYVAYTYELIDFDEENQLPELEEAKCPSCNESSLYLVFEHGIGLLQCRSCLQVIMDLEQIDQRKTG